MTALHVFIKPTGTAHSGDPFAIDVGLFRPTPETLARACAGWLRPTRSPSQPDFVERAVRIAREWDLNALGGAFLAGLESLGFRPGPAQSFVVTGDNLAFVRVVYPDLFAGTPDPATLQKIKNNVGRYAAVRIDGGSADSARAVLLELKRRYRECLVEHVATVDLGDCGDHVVHIPDDVDQDRQQHGAATSDLGYVH